MSSVALNDADLELPPFPVRRWSVEEYQSIARLGILDEDDQLELLDGWIVHKMTKNPLHDGTVDEINRRLSALVPAGWYVRVQNVLLTSDSAPEPDLVVLRGVPRDYMHRHPTAADVALVIEVAETSVVRARLKRGIYARAGVPIYWLVNLSENQIEVSTRIEGTGRHALYRDELILGVEDSISFDIAGHPAITLAVADLLP